MAKLLETYACVPSTERGRGILISGDPKTNAFLYCNGRSVIIRYLDRPLEVEVYAEHAYQTTVARFSPNGEWIASADVSGTVRIYGTHNGFVLKNEFRVLSGRIDDLQWSADGMRIVASGDGKGKSFVRAFMWDSGSNVGEFDGHSRRVLSCAFKPTRPFRIVSCGEDFLVNFYEGPPFKFKQSHRDHSNFVNCVRFSPDGTKFITVSSDKRGLLYDGKTAEVKGELSKEDAHTGSIYSVSWSPDSKQVLTVSADKTAKIWNISEDFNGTVAKTLTCPGSGGVDDMLVGCLWQNDYVVTVSLGGTIYLYSATDLDQDPTVLCGHMKNVNSLAVLNSGPEKAILSSSYDGLIFKWLRGFGYNGKLERGDKNQIKCLVAVDEQIMSSGFDNKIWRIPLSGEECLEADVIDIGSQPKDLSLAVNDHQLALISIETGVVLLKGVQLLACVELGYTVSACAIAPDGNEAIVGGQDGKLHIYSVKGDTLTEESVLEKHRGAITVIRYSPDVSMFASADANREAVVWDRASREVKVKNMLYHTARINSLAWSPDSHMVATGSLDTCVIVYEIDKPASSRTTVKGANLGGVYAVAQLGFTAFFAYLLVKQKFTAYSVNAVVLLTVGAGVLALHTSSDRPEGETKKEYVMGFVLTVAAAVLYGFILPAIELIYNKAKQAITYTLVLEIQMVMCLFATIFCLVGMIVNNDFKVIPREGRDFELGQTKYYIIMCFSALIWQCFFLGAIGVIFCASSLLSGIIIAVLLPVTEVLAVVFYKEKFQAEKGVALVLSLWGFASYFYGEYKFTKKSKDNTETSQQSMELAQANYSSV